MKKTLYIPWRWIEESLCAPCVTKLKEKDVGRGVVVRFGKREYEAGPDRDRTLYAEYRSTVGRAPRKGARTRVQEHLAAKYGVTMRHILRIIARGRGTK